MVKVRVKIRFYVFVAVPTGCPRICALETSLAPRKLRFKLSFTNSARVIMSKYVCYSPKSFAERLSSSK